MSKSINKERMIEMKKALYMKYTKGGDNIDR